MLSQQDQEIRRNVPDPLFAGGSHFCGSGAGDETRITGEVKELGESPCKVVCIRWIECFYTLSS